MSYGRFSDRRAEALHERTLDGCCEQCGDSVSWIWAAWLIEDERVIVTESDQGFVDYDEYTTHEELMEEWNRRTEEADAALAGCED